MPDLKKKVLVQCHGCQWYWRTKYVEGRCPRCNRMGDLTNEEVPLAVRARVYKPRWPLAKRPLREFEGDQQLKFPFGNGDKKKD